MQVDNRINDNFYFKNSLFRVLQVWVSIVPGNRTHSLPLYQGPIFDVLINYV